MSKIYVTAAPDRVARLAPRGRYIPHDKPVPAQLTPYMQRLIDSGDVLLSKKPSKIARTEDDKARQATPEAKEELRKSELDKNRKEREQPTR